MRKTIAIALGFTLSFLLICCAPQKEMTQAIPPSELNFDFGPYIFSWDSAIYVCKQYLLHDFYYEEKPRCERYEDREICTCKSAVIGTIDWVIRTKDNIGGNTLIVWDKNFVAQYILPKLKDEKDRRTVEYTLAHSTDSTFDNIIDYDNKVVINDKAYYYPLRIKKFISCSVDYEELKSVPQIWIYRPDCFDEGKGTYVDLLIPLLDESDED